MHVYPLKIAELDFLHHFNIFIYYLIYDIHTYASFIIQSHFYFLMTTKSLLLTKSYHMIYWRMVGIVIHYMVMLWKEWIKYMSL